MHSPPPTPNSQLPTSSLSYLTGRTRLECHTPGFENIPVGALLPLQVTEETWATTGSRIAADSTRREWKRVHRHYIIRLTAPDGTIHSFLTDPAEAARAPAIRLCPAGRNPPVKHHSLETFIRHFHLPVPAGCHRQSPASHTLLDLLEAITAAALHNEGGHPSPP